MEQNGFKYIFLFIVFRIKTKLYIFYKISVRHKFIGKTNDVENFNIDYIILNGKIIDIYGFKYSDGTYSFELVQSSSKSKKKNLINTMIKKMS